MRAKDRPPAVTWCPCSNISIMDLHTLWTIPFLHGMHSALVHLRASNVGTGMDLSTLTASWLTPWLAYDQHSAARKCWHGTHIWTDNRTYPCYAPATGCAQHSMRQGHNMHNKTCITFTIKLACRLHTGCKTGQLHNLQQNGTDFHNHIKFIPQILCKQCFTNKMLL